MICGRKAPLPGADSPYQGEMSRRDKRGRDAGSAKPRLRGCRRSAGKDPNRKFSLRFGKEETSTEDKKPCLQGFVPSWSFLTRLRRPLLFRLAGKEGGEKGRWVTVGCFLRLNSGKHQCFGLAFHSAVTLRVFYYASPDTVHRICEQLPLNSCGKTSC